MPETSALGDIFNQAFRNMFFFKIFLATHTITVINYYHDRNGVHDYKFNTSPADRGSPMTGSILIADDEHPLLELIKKILTSQGYTCDTVDNVNDALIMIQNNDYHVILTDKNMPSPNGSDEGGLEILEFTLKHNPSTEVIVMTGYATIDSVIKALQLGAFDYISKPFIFDNLIRKINFIRTCQDFINSETITDFYRAYNKSLAEFLDKEYTMDIYRQNKLTAFLNERTTFMFKTIKQLERTAIEERETMGDVATFAGELFDTTPENDERFELIKKIYEKASKRV